MAGELNKIIDKTVRSYDDLIIRIKEEADSKSPRIQVIVSYKSMGVPITYTENKPTVEYADDRVSLTTTGIEPNLSYRTAKVKIGVDNS